MRVVTVTRVQGDMVTVDGNHPLAGEVLNFEVEVTGVREATGEGAAERGCEVGSLARRSVSQQRAADAGHR